LRRDLAPANGKRSIDEADLDEHRRLVPVQMLVRDLVAFELDDGDKRELHALAGRATRPCPMVRETGTTVLVGRADPGGPRLTGCSPLCQTTLPLMPLGGMARAPPPRLLIIRFSGSTPAPRSRDPWSPSSPRPRRAPATRSSARLRVIDTVDPGAHAAARFRDPAEGARRARRWSTRSGRGTESSRRGTRVQRVRAVSRRSAP
jgi:hypothetical protein